LEAAKVLFSLTNNARLTLPVLRDLILTGEKDILHDTAVEISRLGRKSRSIFPDLIKALGSSSSARKVAIIEAFERLGAVAKDAVPALTKCLLDSDPVVQRKALEALKVIRRASPKPKTSSSWCFSY